MAFELIILGALIFIFIVSFCGLLQKIKQTYDRERLLAARLARRREQQRVQGRSDSFSEIYVNPTFITDSNGGVFPAAAPPPYSQYYTEPPPRYDDVIKVHQPPTENQTQPELRTENRSAVMPAGPPAYTIHIENETPNHV